MSVRQTVGAGIGVVAATLLLSASPAYAELGPRCPPRPQEATGAAPATAPEVKPETVHVAFGSKRIQTDRTIKLEVAPKLPADVNASAQVDADLTRPDGEDTFPSDGIVVIARATPSGDARLSICLDPERPEHVEIGRYTGAIDISGSGVKPAAVPLEVTLKDPLGAAIAWSAAGILVGLLLKGFADLRRRLDSAPTWAQVLNYFKQPWVIVSALIGALGALGAIYSVYDANPIWGTTGDGAKLLFAAVTIQVTGMTAVDVVSGKSTPT